ncbi:hypothetical protein CCUS01_09218 [Colletotrichum cuscutae]|uniref:Major facilitator superfamily transporter n=1 Tax=Colletotrichum cuscutae TaxID=1209917 RepID=A0AAI9UHH7_9PEZI|nr:hypothetical protein CCUS01_09218 [Colletotrichum cuscutae]
MPRSNWTSDPTTTDLQSLAGGIILMFTALCSNAGGLLANRIMLGVSEAAIAPGLKQPLRHGAWFLGNTVAGIFGGVVVYAIGIYFIYNPPANKLLIPTTWSFAIFFLLPDTPMKARFLSEADRIKAIERVEENMTGIKSDMFKLYQCVEALTDIKAWLLFGIQISAQIANSGVHGFGSIVIKGMGFSTLNTLLLIFVLMATGGSTYFRNSRTYWMALNLAISIASAAMYCLTIAYSTNVNSIN